jgi:poly(3-hydroxybutyrate) depolymerase
MHTISLPAVILLLATGSAGAASTVRLPPSACPAGESIFRDGFELTAIPSDPSNGSGGLFPGNVTRTVNVAQVGTRSYYLHLPAGYTPAHSWPLLFVFHGASGTAASAPGAAQQVRGDWSALADSQGFIVLSVVGNQSQGGWGASADGAELSAVQADAFAAYNVEQSRVYLWGFSAGAHFGHGVALDNTDFFAAYGVSAGSLEQYACTDDGHYPPTCASLLAGAHPKIPVDIHLGNADPLYLTYGAGNDPARFHAGGWVSGDDLHYTLFNGGHLYTVPQLGEIWNNLCPFALGP